MNEPGSKSADNPESTSEHLGAAARPRCGDSDSDGIAQALGELMQAAQSQGRDTKLVSAMLRAIGDFIASGREPLVLIDAQDSTGLLEPADAAVAASTRDRRPATMSPALRDVLSAVIGSLSDDEAARYLGVGVRQVRRRALEGTLYYFHVGRRRRYPCWQFEAGQSTLAGIRIVVPAIPLSWPPERVAEFMQTPHPRLELDGVLMSPAEWLMNGCSAEKVTKLLGEKRPPEASSRSPLLTTRTGVC